MIQKINETISYIPSCSDPLSADVGIVRGEYGFWIFDVGNGDLYADTINGLPGRKTVILSHFHPDHIANLPKIRFERCYVGGNTYKYCRCGTIADTDLYAEDGHHFHILPFPSSHAKGSLALEVDDRYVFIGDAAGPAVKPGKRVYNTQILIEEIRTLESLHADTVLQSHRMDTPCSRTDLIRRLKEILAGRSSNEALIEGKAF